MVSLARIHLKHLGDPKKALHLFSRYMRHPGPLMQEAMFGRAEAYRALGDSRAEQKALVEFLSAYPEGLYATAISKRLEQLR